MGPLQRTPFLYLISWYPCLQLSSHRGSEGVGVHVSITKLRIGEDCYVKLTAQESQRIFRAPGKTPSSCLPAAGFNACFPNLASVATADSAVEPMTVSCKYSRYIIKL